jgi:hypothetical protein
MGVCQIVASQYTGGVSPNVRATPFGYILVLYGKDVENFHETWTQEQTQLSIVFPKEEKLQQSPFGN